MDSFKKKKAGQLFFHVDSTYEVCMLSSKDVGDVKECVKEGRADKPKAICLLVFLSSGHNKKVSMNRKYINHKQQTNQRHREE